MIEGSGTLAVQSPWLIAKLPTPQMKGGSTVMDFIAEQLELSEYTPKPGALELPKPLKVVLLITDPS